MPAANSNDHHRAKRLSPSMTSNAAMARPAGAVTLMPASLVMVIHEIIKNIVSPVRAKKCKPIARYIFIFADGKKFLFILINWNSL
jgi:hypothetical protein